MDSRRKLNILCLHGHRQNARSFRIKISSFVKSFKNRANFHFISGPHLVSQVPGTEQDDSVENGEDPRTWFHFKDNPDLPVDRLNFLDMYEGFDETLELIRKTLEENGPFDGIFAFSLGSCVVALLHTLQFLYPEKFNVEFRFVILVSGLLKSKSVQQYLTSNLPKFKIRSLHVIGENDAVVVKEKSLDVVELFENPTIYVHSGGHFVPSSGPNRKEFYTVFETFIDVDVVK